MNKMRLSLEWGTGKAKCKVCHNTITTEHKQYVVQGFKESGRFHRQCVQDYTEKKESIEIPIMYTVEEGVKTYDVDCMREEFSRKLKEVTHESQK
jgi:hypothetical protein